MKPQVFISYKSEEYCYADKVRFELERSGVSCWMAPDSIPGGSNYAAEIPKAIRECNAFVMILTDKAQNSKWVPRELDKAINADKRIFPFLPEQIKFNDDISFYLTNVQYYPAYENWDEELDNLIGDVCKYIGIKPIPKAVPQPVTEVPVQPAKTHAAAKVAEKQTVPKKSKVIPEKPLAEKKKKSKKLLIPLIAGGGILVVLIAVILIISSGSVSVQEVSISGETVKLSFGTISLSDKTIAQEDIITLAKTDGLLRISFTDCTFEPEDLSDLTVPSLKYLTMENCNLTDQQFNSLKFSDNQLWELNVSKNKNLKTLTAIMNCQEKLTTLNISNTGIRDFSFLNSFTALEELNADNDEIEDLSFIEGMQKLKKISLDHNHLENLNGLEKCIYLTSLSASDNQLTNISGIKNTTLLEYVNFDRNGLTDISALAGNAQKLNQLHLCNNQIKEAEFLKDAETMLYLDISGNKVSKLDDVYHMKQLQGLDASDNQITTVFSDNFPTSLFYLDLSGNSISELTGTFKNICKNLKIPIINLENNNIMELSFEDNKQFEYLNIHGNPLASSDCLQNLQNVEYLVTDYPVLPSDKMKKIKIYLIDCPLDKQVETEKTLGFGVEFLDGTNYKSAEYSPVGLQDHLMDYQSISKTKNL